jgi:hypothetical protein
MELGGYHERLHFRLRDYLSVCLQSKSMSVTLRPTITNLIWGLWTSTSAEGSAIPTDPGTDPSGGQDPTESTEPVVLRTNGIPSPDNHGFAMAGTSRDQTETLSHAQPLLAKGLVDGELMRFLFGDNRASDGVTQIGSEDNVPLLAVLPSHVQEAAARSTSDLGVGGRAGVISRIVAGGTSRSVRTPSGRAGLLALHPPVYAVSKWGNDLDALLDRYGLSGTYTVWIDADCTISASRATGTGVHYQFKPGCTVSGSGAPTWTIDSPANVDADTRQQLFEPTVAVRFAQSGTVRPGWWGAGGDGSSDDTAAIQAAIDAIGEGTVLIPAGTYLVDGLQVDSGTTLKGDGEAILRLRDHAATGTLNISSQNNIVIEHLTIDMNGSQQGSPNLPAGRHGIDMASADGIRISDCRFLNLFELAVWSYRCNHIGIEKCYFTGDMQGNPTEWRVNDIWLGGTDNTAIEDCIMDHNPPVDRDHGIVGIFLSGCTYIDIKRNQLTYCGRDKAGHHQGAAIDLYHACANVNIEDNRLESCNYYGCRISRCRDVHFTANDVNAPHQDAIIIYSDAAEDAERIWIENNTIQTKEDSSGRGVYIVGNDAAGDEPRDIYVLDNAITRGCYGVWCRFGCRGLTVTGNEITTTYPGIRVDKGTSAVLSDVVIANNHLDMSANETTYALGVAGDAVEVSGNVILNAYRGLSLRVPSGGNVHHNTVEASNYHVLFYSETQGLLFTDNELLGTGPEFYKQGGELVYYGTTAQSH